MSKYDKNLITPLTHISPSESSDSLGSSTRWVDSARTNTRTIPINNESKTIQIKLNCQCLKADTNLMKNELKAKFRQIAPPTHYFSCPYCRHQLQYKVNYDEILNQL